MTKPSKDPIGTPEPFELCTRLFIPELEEFAKNSLAKGNMPLEQAEDVADSLSLFRGGFDDLAQLIEPLRTTPHELRAVYQSLMGVISGAFVIGASVNMTPEAWRRLMQQFSGLKNGERKTKEAEEARKLYAPHALRLAQKIWDRNPLSQEDLAFTIMSQWGDAKYGIPKDIMCPTSYQLQKLVRDKVKSGCLVKRKRLVVKPA